MSKVIFSIISLAATLLIFAVANAYADDIIKTGKLPPCGGNCAVKAPDNNGGGSSSGDDNPSDKIPTINKLFRSGGHHHKGAGSSAIDSIPVIPKLNLANTTDATTATVLFLYMMVFVVDHVLIKALAKSFPN